MSTNASDVPAHRYTASFANAIETHWQKTWLSNDCFATPNPGQPGFDASRPKFYCLDMFPYPSGAGLHIGHPEGYTATDIISRYKRMKGFNVLHPMGWDAFGLPAEQYAIQTGVHPAITTKKAIENFRRQLQRFGFSYDWSREFGTIDPEYYKWTQWIFVQLYNAWFDEATQGAMTALGTPSLREGRTISDTEHPSGQLPSRSEGVPNGPSAGHARPIIDLEAAFATGARSVRFNPSADEVPEAERAREFGAWATLDIATRRRVLDSYRLTYQSTTTVNWCPKLGTVLANDEVIDGKSERGGFPVLRKPLKQWMFRITSYAERLLGQLDGLEWVESTKAMQREWIGRSEGAEIEFEVLMGTPMGTPIGTPSLREGQTITTTDHINALIPSRSEGVPKNVPKTVPAARIREIDANPALARLPVGFVPRDPFPDGIYGASPASVWTQRNLPHARMDDATYFVSWKCQEGIMLDEHERTTVMNAIQHFDGDRCRTYAACVMNNHVHWLIRPFKGHNLTDLCDSVKHFSATQINKARGREGRLWDSESFDHIVRDGDRFAEHVAYIVRNPKEAGVVGDVGQYAWTVVHEDVFGGSPLAERGGTQVGTKSGAQSISLRVFTTRPDTLFGATYMVVAPEHELCASVLQGEANVDALTRDALRAYVNAAKNRSDVERQEAKEKTGAFSGLYAINPATNQPIPIWTADYVLMGYGTGAIMAVPWHDDRDLEFARWAKIRALEVVEPLDAGERPDVHNDGYPTSAFSKPGVSRNSSNHNVFLNGLTTAQAKQKIIEWLESKHIGQRKINYKLRDWTFSRQRYWGEPFPVVYDDAGIAYPIEASHLPVLLPELADYAPVESDDPQPLLAKARDWMHTTAGKAGVSPALLAPETPVTRETNTMPGSAGSSWYAIRYCDPKNTNALVGKEAEGYWMGAGLGTPSLREGRSTSTIDRIDESFPSRSEGVPISVPNEVPQGIDLYLGGSEHAVGHLLYSRFWQNVLFDLGHVSCKEPFRKLFHQGLITSFAYQRADKSIVPVDEVKEVAEGQPELGYVEIATGQTVTPIITKMSKRYKNVINPDDVINEFGADTCRLYEMYMGPLEASKPWNPRDIIGCFRFLQRAWRACVDEATGQLRLAELGSVAAEGRAATSATIEKLLHRLTKKVGDDIERLSFNTAIAAMMEFVGSPSLREGSDARGVITRAQMERFALVLAPFAPHLAEELWQKLGHGAGTRSGSIAVQPWPLFDAAMLVDDEIEIPISVMGKVRTRITVPMAIAKDAKALEAAAMADAKVQELIAGKEIKKAIIVPGKMVNLVLG